jgi:AraC-like DNA-binding protein
MSGDALLEAIRAVRQRKEKADRDMRLLLAYAREHVTPRPYRLADLAQAAGLSISGVRTAYSQADIDLAAQAVSADSQRHIHRAVMALLARGERPTAPGHVTAA